MCPRGQTVRPLSIGKAQRASRPGPEKGRAFRVPYRQVRNTPRFMFRPEKARKSSASRKRRASSAVRRNTGRKISFAKHALRRRPSASGPEKALRAENKPRVFSDIATKKRFRVRQTKHVSLRPGSPARSGPGRGGNTCFPSADETSAAFAGTPRQIPRPGGGRGNNACLPSADETSSASLRKTQESPLPGRGRRAFCRPLPSAAERCPPRKRKRVSGCACCLPTRGRPWAARAGR